MPPIATVPKAEPAMHSVSNRLARLDHGERVLAGSPDWITASVFWMLGLEIEGDLRLAHQVARRVDEGVPARS